MRTKLVTSYYAFHNGEPFWGQYGRDRWYKYSLASICELGCEVICYTDEGELGYNIINQIKEEYKLDNLTIKIFNLIDNQYQDKVYNIRMKDPEKFNNPSIFHYYNRSPQIYWNKFTLLENEFESNINLYWIDCGLAHTGLFPPHMSKYSEEEGYATYYSGIEGNHLHKQYYFDKAFNPKSLERINNFSKGKIINICRDTTHCNLSEFNQHVETIDYQNIFPVGGFFGGNSNLILEYTKECKKLINNILKDENYFCGDEEILIYINAKHREWFSNWLFDNFYHEGWKDLFPDGTIGLYHFFTEKLNDK